MLADKLAEIIKDSKKTVFFGGAGVSTASGIPDFRSAGGVFSKRICKSFTAEEVVSYTFYKNHPEEFFEFYKERLVYPAAEPNACHIALANLEKNGKMDSVITQNIDGLHQIAGSKNVMELHGSIHRNYCERCGSFYGLDFLLKSSGVPLCEKCGGRVKPDVVLYGESLNSEILENSIIQIRGTDTLIVGGTSLLVYPAAGLIQYFQGRNLVLINKDTTTIDKRADLVIKEDIASVFKTVMKKVCK